jgi:hypothetical protein
VLTANCNGYRVDAASSSKGPSFECPKCGREVTLKKGQIKIAHFAHKPPTDCTWASGETQAHMEAKTVLRDSFRALGYGADYDVEVLSTGGDRRADVLVTSQDGLARWAIEVQHTPILFDAIEKRTTAYCAAGIPVLWMGILSKKMKEDAQSGPSGLTIRQYTIRPWEKWAQALAFKELWYVDPDDETRWRGSFTDHLIHVESSSWYSEGGEEQSAGGYSRKSKRWRTLNLQGPFRVHQLSLGSKWRKAWSSPVFKLPGGVIAQLTIR